jgi:putative ABC transport system permease protein
MEPEGGCTASLDSELRPVAVPPGGVVLTDHLANEILHVRPGDLLTVEVLEGSRPVRQVPVLGITKQYLGVSAYMELGFAQPLHARGRPVSGAYLARRRATNWRRCTRSCRTPRACWAWWPTSRRSAASTRRSASSCCSTPGHHPARRIIAFGVVYNSARIALSERGRELASLRVLGFTRGEIAYILLGELGLLTLAVVSGLVVRQRLDRLDLIGVLKTKE